MNSQVKERTFFFGKCYEKLSAFTKFFKRRKRLKERGIYAVTAGDHVGDFYLPFVFKNDGVIFIQIPDFKKTDLDIKTIDTGLQSGVLDLVRVLPIDVYDSIVREFVGRQANETTS